MSRTSTRAELAMANLRARQRHTGGCEGNGFVQRYCRTLEMAAGQGWGETQVFVSSGARCDFDCPTSLLLCRQARPFGAIAWREGHSLRRFVLFGGCWKGDCRCDEQGSDQNQPFDHGEDVCRLPNVRKIEKADSAEDNQATVNQAAQS